MCFADSYFECVLFRGLFVCLVHTAFMLDIVKALLLILQILINYLVL